MLRNKEVKTAPITSRQTTFRPWKAKNISKQAAAGGMPHPSQGSPHNHGPFRLPETKFDICAKI